ncbi:MAG: glycosyltransferase family 2 protein [Candidatus Sabulitectum sp.]|nr:glycosyltransferase family 2 protein [Candidatus Sabulitectum sp.]
MKNVTAVVVLYNGEKLVPHLAETINSLPADLKTVVYDSGSTDGSAQTASRLLKNAFIIEGANHGFGFGNNRCFEKVDTEYTLLLNSDASIDRESLGRLVSFLDSNPDYAGVQPLVRLWGWEKVTVSSGVFLTEYGEAWDGRFMHLELSPVKTALQVPAITAAVSLWRTKALKSVNGFDEDYFMYFEDADLSLRLGAAGWKLAVVRAAEATHMVGASSRRQSAVEWELESSIRMFRRYFGNGKLSVRWWKREARIILHSIFSGKSPLWRIALVFRVLGNNVDAIIIPEDVKALLFGDPMDYPLPRIGKNSPGPGWTGNVISPWGGLKTDGGFTAFLLTASDHTVTGAVSSGQGETLNRFCISTGATLKVKLAESPSLVYIHCDSSTDKVEVTKE